jgi:hypothetical protein
VTVNLGRSVAIDPSSSRHYVTSTLGEPWQLQLLLLRSQLLLFHETIGLSIPRLRLVMGISYDY